MLTFEIFSMFIRKYDISKTICTDTDQKFHFFKTPFPTGIQMTYHNSLIK